MKTKSLEEFEEKFRVKELAIFRSVYWTWSIRPVQSTVGAGILSLNRFARSFAEITPEEGADLASTLREIESALQKFSKPEKINYLMLMMVDLHLHFHVLPRYSTPRTVGGSEWIDSGWPALPAMGDYADRENSHVLSKIRDTLRNFTGPSQSGV